MAVDLDRLGTCWRCPSIMKGIVQPLWEMKRIAGQPTTLMVCWEGGDNLVARGVTNRTVTFNSATTLPSLAISWVEVGEEPDQVIEQVKKTPLYLKLLKLEKQGHFGSVFPKKE